jgi:hypothetical protein
VTAYVLVGLADAEQPGTYDGRLCVSVSADPLTGSESILLDDTAIPDAAKSFMGLPAAITYGDLLNRMDKRLWPPFNPVVGEAVDGQLAALLLPPVREKSDRLVRTAAYRYGITVRRLQTAV